MKGGDGTAAEYHFSLYLTHGGSGGLLMTNMPILPYTLSKALFTPLICISLSQGTYRIVF